MSEVNHYAMACHEAGPGEQQWPTACWPAVFSAYLYEGQQFAVNFLGHYMKTGPVKGNAPAARSKRRRDTQPLLRALVAKAGERGDSMVELAKRLGVTYERFAQWRRAEAQVSKAHEAVFERAAEYLGIPIVVAMVLAGRIGLQQLAWPSGAPLADRIRLELESLRGNPFIGAFVPAEIDEASPAVQMFVIFLAHEVAGGGGSSSFGDGWLSALNRVAAGTFKSPPDENAPGRRQGSANRIF